jgi:hypothetical protein
MNKMFLLLFLFLSVYFQAQVIENKEAFRKCRKDFSKKTCLSDEDGDGFLFYLDKCPKEAGEKDNLGCPWSDSDGDSLIDKYDECPTVMGAPENNGCPWPDHDHDGLPDKDDSCPMVPGLKSNNGCPLCNKPPQ